MLLLLGLIFACVGALIHVYIFVLESVSWTTPRARAVFGTTVEEAETTRALAFNQGFYNLFLAIIVAAGVVLISYGAVEPGMTAVLIGAGSMVAAALVLAISSPDKIRAAATQGLAALVGVILLVVGLLV